MTVIAWDGYTLAADRQGTNNGHTFRVMKMHPVPDGVAAITGELDKGLVLVQWYRDGADPAKYPAFQAADNWCRLVVYRRDGTLLAFEQQPVSAEYQTLKFHAWGSGRDVALGAMACGKRAREAVKIASQLCDCCGFGVTSWSPDMKKPR